jgi:hypothetical protein
MKEAIAQTFIVSLILFFFGILLILFFGSINYSKAFKAKNKIINLVEKYGDSISSDDTVKQNFKTEFERELSAGGYQTIEVNKITKNLCDKYYNGATGSGETLIYPSESDTVLKRTFDFCLIRKTSETGPYYQVITFMRFDVPIIGDSLVFPVRGETKVLCENIDTCVK